MEIFKEIFVTKQNDVNSNKDRLLPLTTKTKVFLLQTFEKVYRNLRKSKSIQTAKGEYRFRLASLNIVANKKQMPLGFSSNRIPSRDKCDYCGMLLNISIQNPIVLAYGHRYHEHCLNMFFQKCFYCQIFLEQGVQLNISSLITQLTKQDVKDLVEGDQESKGQKKTKDTDAKNLSSEDDILTQLKKNGSVLNRVEEACNIALDKFLKA
ncbi:34228_t:CDS:1 [Racocetra persica]|uniref:34228_t:CDS:1 n=1 Tax=Racocetra persica TaxID=160502 RepID=A0ACA9PS74_9GLOM|nr:34228_t:CDS:1 [Racocetra persica]